MVSQQKRHLQDDLGAHCRWLCRHPDFVVSDRLRLLLSYLVARALSGGRQEVSQREIALEVMEFDASFDPRIDAHVRIEVSRLRKALDHFYATREAKPTARIIIPKGRYRPHLEAQVTQRPATRAEELPDTLKVAVATFDDGVKGGGALADLIRRETLYLAHRSPLVQAESLLCVCLRASSEAEGLDEAARVGARYCVIGKLHFAETAARSIYLSIFDVLGCRSIWSESLSYNQNSPSAQEIARQVADRLVTVVADPMTGLVPRMHARAHPGSSISALVSAYDFIRTQKLNRVAPALSRLSQLEQRGLESATSLALQADMIRVQMSMGPWSGRISSDEILEKASLALERDPENLTARLSMGYALLHSGRVRAAARVARGILAEVCPRSLVGDAKVLLALAGSGVQQEARNMDEGIRQSLFYEDLAIPIASIMRGDYGQAATMLDTSIHEGVFWLQLLRTAVFRAEGDLRSSMAAKRRLFALVPDIESLGEGLVASFFVDPSVRDFFRDSLKLQEAPQG